MKIIELFEKLGLKPDGIEKIISDIEVYNSLSKEKPVTKLNLNSSIDTITLRQTPFIGKVLGTTNGIAFLDEKNRYPLTIDVNAMRYAALAMDEYFRKA